MIFKAKEIRAPLPGGGVVSSSKFFTFVLKGPFSMALYPFKSVRVINPPAVWMSFTIWAAMEPLKEG